MARTKEQDITLANSLGISYDELQQTDYKLIVVMDDSSNLGDMPVEVIVRFGKTSPKHILAKIKGINKDNEVSLSPGDAGE
ncbi:hypothetical protein SAMN04488128_105490 [Chitinophaga eiseniae]|uniref:Uncharacterized protein n=1 Tax=Chitinophaga eiseniae TaxID=634771 RepID=A0A1T4TMG1_9BACT|nr:hypothetical protein [Chitinophaga eiseniae]SKA41656.1 hypothetical protein SAMN04488128_105490 [Chitinophaga eiseniae]